MSGQTSDKTVKAIALLRDGYSPYAAAKSAGIALSTMYRSKLYKAWRNDRAPDPNNPNRKEPTP